MYEKESSSGPVTIADVAAAASNVTASRRVAAEISRRRATNPKFSLPDLRRELEASANRTPRGVVTKEDFLRATGDAAIAQKIGAEVHRRRQTDPKFTFQDLRTEVFSAPPKPAHPGHGRGGDDLQANILTLRGITKYPFTSDEQWAYAKFQSSKPEVWGGSALTDAMKGFANERCGAAAIRQAADEVLGMLDASMPPAA